MGINFTDIVVKNERKLSDFSGKTIALDGYNILYQFISTIRQPDGQPLRSSRGAVTSHLAGALYRTTNLIEAGIKPVYVFDGKPHPLKARTLKERKDRKVKAAAEWEKALKDGDMERARTKAQQTSRLTREMVEDAKVLLTFLGVPWVQAPGEGEAQASVMAMERDVWGCGSQDFDSVLFGAPHLVRNLTSTGRRKIPRRQEYVTISPEEIVLEDTLAKLEITREQLVDVALLVGTDFNEGIKGIGPKKALKLMQKHGNLEEIVKEKGFELEDVDEIRKIFLTPDVTKDYRLEWERPDVESVIAMLCGQFEFSENRVKSSLKKLETVKKSESQQSLDKWF